MKQNILIILLLTVVFMYGVVVGTKEIFPYQQIKYIKKLILNVNENADMDDRICERGDWPSLIILDDNDLNTHCLYK